MKTIINAAVLALFGITAAHAQIKSPTEQLSDLNAANRNWEALNRATGDFDRLRRELKIDQIVAEVEAEYARNRKEVVTNTSTGEAGGLILSGSFHHDATDWVVINAKEEAQIPLKQMKKGEELEALLDLHIVQNKSKIVEYKVTGAWILKILNDLAATGDIDSRAVPMANRVANAAKKVTFKGRNAQLECLTEDHASASSGFSLGIKLFVPILTLGAGNEQKPYVSTTCAQAISTIEATATMGVIDTLDLLVDDWSQQVKTTVLFTPATGVDPDFGNPYLQ